MAKKKKFKNLTVSIIHDQSEIYNGPLDKVPDTISEENVDEVNLHGNDKKLVATMDYQYLATLMGKDL